MRTTICHPSSKTYKTQGVTFNLTLCSGNKLWHDLQFVQILKSSSVNTSKNGIRHFILLHRLQSLRMGGGENCEDETSQRSSWSCDMLFTSLPAFVCLRVRVGVCALQSSSYPPSSMTRVRHRGQPPPHPHRGYCQRRPQK